MYGMSQCFHTLHTSDETIFLEACQDRAVNLIYMYVCRVLCLMSYALTQICL